MGNKRLFVFRFYLSSVCRLMVGCTPSDPVKMWEVVRVSNAWGFIMKRMCLALFVLLAASNIGLAQIVDTPVIPENPVAVKARFDMTLKHVDVGGDLLLVTDVSDILENLLRDIADTFAIYAPPEDTDIADSLAVFNRLRTFLKANGAYSARSVGISSSPRKGEHVYTFKLFVQRDADAANLPLLRALDGPVGKQAASVGFLPADTQFAMIESAELSELWTLVRNGIRQVLPPEPAQEFDKLIRTSGEAVKQDLDKLMASLGDEWFLSIQMSPDKTVSLGDMAPIPVSIPEPSFLLGIALKDETLPGFIAVRLAESGSPVTTSRVGDTTLTTVMVPVPTPFPVAPTYAMHSKFLLIGSNPRVVEQAIAAMAQKNGLASTPAFREAFGPVSGPYSGLLYVDPRLSKVLADIQVNSITASSLDPDAAKARQASIRALLARKPPFACAMRTANLPEGVLVQGRTTASGKETLVAISMSPLGLVAGMALPSFFRARTMSKRYACINNLRMIDSGKEQWAMANSKSDGSPVDIDGANQYIKGSTTPRCPQGGTYIYGNIGEDPQCSLHGGMEMAYTPTSSAPVYAPPVPRTPVGQMNLCVNQLRQIDSAKEQWAMATMKADGAMPDLAGVNEYIKGNRTPVCPAGGTYNYLPIGQDPVCSAHGSMMKPHLAKTVQVQQLPDPVALEPSTGTVE